MYEGYDRDAGARARWDPANPGNRAIHAERTARLGSVLHGLAGPVLEVGCGTGQVLEELAAGGLDVAGAVGVDLSAARLTGAAGRLPSFGFVQAEGSALPLRNASVGTAVAFTLFSSLLDDALAAAVAGELTRVVRPGGALLWYDLRRGNPRNRSVRPWTRDAVAALFPDWTVELAPVTVLPPLARRLGPATAALYPRLARVGPATTHLVGVARRPA